MKKNKKKYYLRLRDLRNSVKIGRIDHAEIMRDLLGYTNNWFTRKFLFLRYFKKAFLITRELEDIDPLKVEWSENCKIKRPKSIDFISYRAMMELQMTINNISDEDDVIDLIAKVISISCYGENIEGNYNSNTELFKEFRDGVLSEPALHMFGLYNWIMKSIEESSEVWDKRFFSVEVVDEDYLKAGGSSMNQFNVINTVKSICQDFNLTYDEAWQMSYNLVQTNSYAKATANYIQDQMRILKEIKMKRERGH